jgi:glycerol-3-phosphate acyltransferase PlsX
MGGDNAPGVEVQGAIDAVKQMKDITVILVGKKDLLEKLLEEKKVEEKYRSRLEIVHASDVITMSDEPAKAYKQKPDASIIVAARLVREGKGDALVSAGNTGAVLVTSLLSIGRIPGVIRPAILALMPSKCGVTAILDAGANVDCKPIHLAQFAVMGNLYLKHIFMNEKPRVGIMSVGEEDEKGNELTWATREIIEKLGLNFIGNVEGRDVFNGNADVIICDGFVGNVILKTAEGIASYLLTTVKDSVKKSNIFIKLGAIMMKPVFVMLKKKSSPDEYGGAPLLGIKKPVIITHGSANEAGIKNGIRNAAKFITEHVNDEIEREVKKVEAKVE